MNDQLIPPVAADTSWAQRTRAEPAAVRRFDQAMRSALGHFRKYNPPESVMEDIRSFLLNWQLAFEPDRQQAVADAIAARAIPEGVADRALHLSGFSLMLCQIPVGPLCRLAHEASSARENQAAANNSCDPPRDANLSWQQDHAHLRDRDSGKSVQDR
jgi:hypothetical protein